MAKSSSKSEKITAKLRKLSKDDLIWCILEMEKHSLGHPSISSILSDIEYKKTLDNIECCKKLERKAYEKTMAYYDLLAPYEGKPLSEIPQPIFDQAIKLIQEAEAADKEWFRLSGIKEKR